MSERTGPSGRALGLAAAGAAAMLASRGFGTTALATLGVGMLALPVLVTAVVWGVSAGLRVRRAVEPARARAGEAVTLRATLEGWPVRVGLDRLLEVSVDPGAGAAGGAMPPRPRGAGAWALRAARGDHRLPPARVTLRDPFGLARRARRGDEDGAALLVVPAAPRIGRAPAGTRAPGHGRRRGSAQVGFGELDRVREYRAGDALSRVHWGQTAKRGRLQTKELRSSEAAGRSLMLLLDGAVPAGEAFETSVVAAAAIARHHSMRGEPLAFRHTGAEPLRIPAARAGWPVIEVAMARVAAGGERALSLAVRGATSGADAPDALTIVTCGGDPGLPGAVAQARAHGVGVAVVLAGAAAAAADELAAVGAEVVVVSGPDRVAAALEGGGMRARAV